MSINRNCWKVTVLTLFPEIFPGPLQYSIAGKAMEKQLWNLDVYNIRSFSEDKHKTVDDKPFGGGTGMVIKPDVIGNAIDFLSAKQEFDEIIYFSPRGEIFKQGMAEEFIEKNNILILCGRYEGIDQRVIEHYNIREVSVGDFILSGGEIAAITVLDSCIRLIPQVITKRSALYEESFSTYGNYKDLLEYPHYTRPAKWKNKIVPDILVSGHHENVKQWRLNEAEAITKTRRMDLWKKYQENK